MFTFGIVGIAPRMGADVVERATSVSMSLASLVGPSGRKSVGLRRTHKPNHQAASSDAACFMEEYEND